jgi:putative transposase
MESFFAPLQSNVLNRQSRPGRSVLREELRVAIITWIERTYHHRRRQRALGKLTPVEYGVVIGYNRLTQAA